MWGEKRLLNRYQTHQQQQTLRMKTRPRNQYKLRKKRGRAQCRWGYRPFQLNYHRHDWCSRIPIDLVILSNGIQSTFRVYGQMKTYHVHSNAPNHWCSEHKYVHCRMQCPQPRSHCPSQWHPDYCPFHRVHPQYCPCRPVRADHIQIMKHREWEIAETPHIKEHSTWP